MKLTVILLFAACLQISAKSEAQQITLSEVNTPLKRVFDEMRRQTGYFFFYDLKELKGARPVTIQVKNAGLEETLKLCLADQPLTYALVNKTVVIRKKEEEKKQLPPLPIDITGTVRNRKGEILTGVTVVIKGTDKGMVTDEHGEFRISISGDKKAVLEFSMIGYETQSFRVNNQTNLHIVLTEAVSGLNEIVIVAYGTAKKTSLTAAVSTLQGADVAQKPLSDLSNGLVGRVPGIIADQGSGEPGLDGARIRIRGSSTTGNADPLIVVDGIPRSFGQLDPNSIESYTILKDAAAIAPYGLSGANGVILVTTKKGKLRTPNLSYNGYVGFQSPTRIPKMVNSYQYALLQNEAAMNSGLLNKPFSDADIAQYKKTVDGAADADRDRYPNSRGLRDVVSNNYLLTYHNLELSGGTEKVRYYAALGYTSQQGQFQTTFLKKYNVTTRVDVKATQTTNISLALNGYVVDKNYSGKVDLSASDPNNMFAAAGGGIMYQAFRTPPTSPIYYSNGLWGSYIGRSLVGYIYNSGYAFYENTQILSTFSIEQQLPFVKGLSIKGVASYDPYNSYSKVWQTPVLSYSADLSVTPYKFTPGYSELASPQLNLGTGQNKAFTYQGYLNYHNSFGEHDISFLGVIESRTQKSWNMSAMRKNYPIDIDELDQGGVANGEMTNGGWSSKQAQIGYLYRVNYGFKGKYLFEAVGRYDGHYYFAPGKQYAFFPAFSAGWNIGKENFLSNARAIGKLKLRVSYGESGNLAGGPYQYLAGYSLYGNAAVFNGNPTTGVYENSQANPSITWERARKFDVGVEGSLWKGALTFEVDYFREKRSNMLVTPNVIVPEEYGIGLPQVNGGVEGNQGIDLSLGSTLTFANGMRLGLVGNFTYAQNKLLQVFETDATYNNPNRRRTGRANGTQFGLKALGYFTPNDFDAMGKLKPGIGSIQDAPVQPGDIKYADISGPDGKPDGKIDANDETVIGRPNGSPQMIFGFSPTLSYKGFDLNLLLQGAAQVTLPVGGSLVTPFDQQGSATELAYKDHWTPANPNALYPRVYSQAPGYNGSGSSWWLRDASYLKLRNMELGYTLPYSTTRHWGIQRLRAYVAGQNLWTWTPHIKEMIDPEARSANGQYYFQQKVLSFGLNVTF